MDMTKEETALLISSGYVAGYAMDIREGDEVAIAPVTRTDFNGGTVPLKHLTVTRLFPLAADYTDYDDNNRDFEGRVRHTVIVFIGTDINGLPEHCSYGNTYPVFIKKPEEHLPWSIDQLLDHQFGPLHGPGF